MVAQRLDAAERAFDGDSFPIPEQGPAACYLVLRRSLPGRL